MGRKIIPARWCALVVSLAALPAMAHAAETPEAEQEALEIVNDPAADKNVFVFDFGVPSSPGLTLLDVDKDKVTQSNSLKPFVLSLPGVLASGENGQAVAFDASLGSAFIPSSRQKYSIYGRRALLFRTRLNVALYEGVDDDDEAKDKPSRAAVGLSTSLLNSSDPLLAAVPGGKGPAFIQCLDSIKRDEYPVPQFDAAKDEAALAEFKKSNAADYIPTCMKVADLAARLATDIDLGAGLLFEGNPGKLSGFGDEAAVFWGSFRTGLGVSGPDTTGGTSFDEYKRWYDEFGRWFMVGASGRVGLSETISTGDSTTPQVKADTFVVWAGLESYSKSNRLAVQIGQQKIDPDGTANSAFGGTRTVYHASFDQALGDTGLWVSLSYGKAEGEGALKSDSVARVTITFAAPTAKKIFGAP